MYYVLYILILNNFSKLGLPVSVTLSLLLIAMRMKKSRVLVKNLTVIETLSCVNVIASDKTGTLTQNKMFVASAMVGTDPIDLDNANVKNRQENSHLNQTIGFNQLVASAGLCNNAAFDEQDMNESAKHRRAKGDATDIALLRFSAEYAKIADVKRFYQVNAEIPFNSRNKWMVKVVKPMNREVHEELFGPSTRDSSLCLLKGAPDYLLRKSSHVIMSDGSSTALTADLQDAIVKVQNSFCLLGQRVLLVCKKECYLEEIITKSRVDEKERQKEQDQMGVLEKYIQESNDFCVIGLVGIIDPPREGIADVLAKCRKAGIRVFMVTGDYALTAAAIATQIGILTQPQYDTVESMRIKHKENHESYESSALLLTGSDLDSLSSEDWRLVTPYNEIVFARTTPEQKLKTVKGKVKSCYFYEFFGLKILFII